MGNTIKYNTNSESKALKVNNFWIGTGDVDKGPTENTGFYNSVNPPSGGYTIYLNKASGGPSIYVASNDAQLITLTNMIANTSYTGVTQCFNYFRGESDKVLFNREYENIVTDGLVLNLDAAFVPSYPYSGTTWYDLSGNGNNATLVSNPTFESLNGGSFNFNGNSYASLPSFTPASISGMTVSCWVKLNSSITNTFPRLIECKEFSGWGGNINAFSFLPTPTNNIYYLNWTTTPFTSGAEDVIFENVINLDWQMFTIVASTDTLTMYVDGVQVATSVNGFLPYGVQMNSNFIAKGNDPSAPLLDGKIATMAIYNRALSSTEVLQNYNAILPRFTPSIVTSNLVMNLDASNPNSYPGTGTLVTDLSGNGNNGTMRNVGFDSEAGGTFTFNYSGEISCGLGQSGMFNTMPDGTLSVWVKTSNAGGSYRGIATKQASFGLFDFNNELSLYDWGNNERRASGVYINDNVWRYITLTFNDINGTPSNNAKIYVNGSLVLTTTVKRADPNFGPTVPLSLGSGEGIGGSQLFGGRISAAHLYNRKLSDAEVLQNYNATKSRFGL